MSIASARDGSPRPGPFEVLLGATIAGLPEPVRRFHTLGAPLAASGRADITVAPGLLPRLLCRLAGLPRPGRGVPCSVVFTPLDDGREHWQRDFAGRRYASVMRVSLPPPHLSPPAGGEGKGAHLVERFGPLGIFDLHFLLTPAPRGLDWSLVGWKLLAIPLPAATVPRIACLEYGDGGRFCFDIDVAFPWIGHVIRYAGWLESSAAPPRRAAG